MIDEDPNKENKESSDQVPSQGQGDSQIADERLTEKYDSSEAGSIASSDDSRSVTSLDETRSIASSDDSRSVTSLDETGSTTSFYYSITSEANSNKQSEIRDDSYDDVKSTISDQKSAYQSFNINNRNNYLNYAKSNISNESRFDIDEDALSSLSQNSENESNNQLFQLSDDGKQNFESEKIVNIHTVAQLRDAGYRTLFHIEEKRGNEISTSAAIPIKYIRGHHRFKFEDYDKEKHSANCEDINNLFDSDFNLIDEKDSNKLIKIRVNGEYKVLPQDNLDQVDIKNLYDHHNDQITPIRNENIQLNKSGLVQANYEGNEGHTRLGKDVAKLKYTKQEKDHYSSMIAKVENTNFTSDGSEKDVYYIISAYCDKDGKNIVTQSGISKEKYLELEDKAQENFDKIKNITIRNNAFKEIESIIDGEKFTEFKEHLKSEYNFSFEDDLPIYLQAKNKEIPIRDIDCYQKLHSKIHDQNENTGLIKDIFNAGLFEKNQLAETTKKLNELKIQESTINLFNDITKSLTDTDEDEKKKKAERLLKLFNTIAYPETEILDDKEKDFVRKISYNMTLFDHTHELQEKHEKNKQILELLTNKENSLGNSIIDDLSTEYGNKTCYLYQDQEKVNKFKEKLSAEIPTGIGSTTISNRDNDNSKVDVVFTGGNKGDHDIAWVYLPGTKECYLKAQVCHEDNKSITYYRNGKEVTGIFNKGDIIINENTVFEKSNKDGENKITPINLKDCSELTKFAFKKLDLRVISALDSPEKEKIDVKIATQDDGKAFYFDKENSKNQKISEDQNNKITENKKPSSSIKPTDHQQLSNQKSNIISI